MIFLRNNNRTQFSPCIISKVKYKLHLKGNLPINNKKCSITYWNEACEVVGSYYNLDIRVINSAKAGFNQL
jgi:hypothetical protein